MRTFRPAAVILLPSLLAHAGCYSSNSAAPEVLRLVRSLGRADFKDFNTVKDLHACAHEAAPLLVEELKVVDSDWPDPKTMHVIWCIRALRSMTGENFERPTHVSGSFAMEEVRLRDEPMPFFFEWMSRGRIFLAPKDVQAAVIEDWKKWIGENPNFQVQKHDAEFGDYYW